MKTRNDPRGLLPLSPLAFHMLVALADTPRHGYSISKEVETLTDGAIKLGPGTLYRLIKEMLADGWIAEAAGGDADPRRKYYRLTPWGRRIAQAEAERLDDLLRVARSRRLLAARGELP